MTRRVKREDWDERCQHLEDARAYLAQARADRSKRHLLDRAIWGIWTFGEFAVNVALELTGEAPETHHNQAVRARELFGAGALTRDYSKALAQLAEYRLRADYSIYSTAPSVHYTPRNVADCLGEMEQLRIEIEALLKQRGRWS